MSIPFFFQPVHVTANDTTLEVKVPSTGATSVHFAETRHTWVEGSVLAKYPLHSFDRVGDTTPEVSTIGIKLSRIQTEYESEGTRESGHLAGRCLKTLMNEGDAMTTHDHVAHRTIFVDGSGVSPTDFDLSDEQQDRLFLAGVSATTQYVIDVADPGAIPRH